MRYALSIVLLTLFLSPLAFAADKKKAVTFDGTIVKLDKNRLNFDATDAKGKPVHGYAYTDNTIKVTVDGKEATMRDLRLGMHVVVTMRNKQVADSIVAETVAKKEWDL